MSDPSTGSLRVRELLTETRKARALRSRLLASGSDPSLVEARLQALHLEIGVAFVDAIEAGQVFVPVVDSLDYELEERDANWYTEDPSLPGVTADSDEPLFDPEDLVDPTAGGLGDFDDSTPVMPGERDFPYPGEPSGSEPDFVVASVAGFRAERDQDPASPWSLLAAGAGSAWKQRLDELLALLALPRSFADADELAIEASRVQWATNDLETRLLGLPPEIRIGLVAMLAARAQHLRARLDLDVGPRMSLDRLQRYRLDRDLPAMAGLLPTPRPEHGSWEEDARQWWLLLGWTP
jgi:hypothetical protein